MRSNIPSVRSTNKNRGTNACLLYIYFISKSYLSRVKYSVLHSKTRTLNLNMGASKANKTGPILDGLTLASLKKNYPLIPLFIALGVGVAGATFYTARLAFRNPDVTWSLKKNPEPWEEYRNKQYKLYSTVDYKDFPTKAPEY